MYLASIGRDLSNQVLLEMIKSNQDSLVCILCYKSLCTYAKSLESLTEKAVVAIRSLGLCMDCSTTAPELESSCVNNDVAANTGVVESDQIVNPEAIGLPLSEQPRHCKRNNSTACEGTPLRKRPRITRGIPITQPCL